ncbi:hypothetical protein Psed_5792 [Pseudonocardia dioxanivorans CB1190]|uniref:Phage gp6-like head-tail connector protein n=1 Tax=Pseudonocardia dioxanivorans (strain ATCC 55486 / DSM 44775 / JCM 13855 / CB1190) TaxID=675635 RepID=F4D1D1_PSEUX|nr:head-tail connector protein [Pseudonocardia dioxanivorans]AEA27919.1 hypothetical protein Psed_5792 [Pseudonocardia dioxanivorans CB1190]
MYATEVLSLEAAKAYLNEDLESTVNDDELTEFIEAAVARVDKHLGLDQIPGAGLAYAAEVTPLQRLAVKTVLRVYWDTQRTSVTDRNGYTAQPWEDDNGPAGTASIRSKLTDLLGQAAAEPSGSGAAPQGAFPPPSCWPDPADRRRGW